MNRRVAVEEFEAQYSAAPDGDPWRYRSSEYEAEKYQRTLAALGERHVGSAFEAGCSIGVFTALLAERCDELEAADFSEHAVAEARERTQDLPNVSVARLVLPEEMPAGPFDLVVCSDVLYYWSPELVREGLSRFEAALAPGGSLLVVNWDGDDPDAPLDGEAVRGLIAENTRLVRGHSGRHPGYLIDRWDDRGENAAAA